MPNIVEVSKLTKQYGSFAALDGCTLSIQEGSVFGLLGPNGAGKTTMIRCLLGYLKPTSGSAFIDGVDCIRSSLQVRQRVSYLPAESKMFRLMRGKDCIEFFASIHPRGNQQLALSIAKRLELDTSRRVAFMSTGMRQKLAISCVMSCQSRLMILDEPTANLDPTVRSEVLRLVRESNGRGTTIAFCSHVLDEITEVCDHAAIMKKGKVETTINLNELKFVHRVRAVVPQDAFLFSDSIKNNIKFGDENATDDEVIEAAKKAVVHENILTFNDQYETILGERGITLSGGQKQRVSIARALIKNAPILLLDDCLSAVDTETEETILNNLLTYCKDKTTIIVSHRVSSAKNADQIIILEDGKIIEKGTHNELIEQNGYYKELYVKQLSEKEIS